MMRSALVHAIAIAIVLVPRPGVAGSEWVDRSEISVTLGDMAFTDDDADGVGVMGGLEARTPVASRWSIGAALSTGEGVGLLGDQLTAVPVELNIVRLFPASGSFAGEVGAGLAAVYGSHTIDVWFDNDIEADDWLFGGQVFGGLTWVPSRLLLGADVKYQMNQELEVTDVGLDNFRVVARLGLAF